MHVVWRDSVMAKGRLGGHRDGEGERDEENRKEEADGEVMSMCLFGGQDGEGEKEEAAKNYGEEGEVVRDAELGFPFCVWWSVTCTQYEGRKIDGPGGYSQSWMGHGKQHVVPSSNEPRPQYLPEVSNSQHQRESHPSWNRVYIHPPVFENNDSSSNGAVHLTSVWFANVPRGILTASNLERIGWWRCMHAAHSQVLGPLAIWTLERRHHAPGPLSDDAQKFGGTPSTPRDWSTRRCSFVFCVCGASARGPRLF